MKEIEGLDVTIAKESIVCDACYEKQYRIICQKGDQNELRKSIDDILIKVIKILTEPTKRKRRLIVKQNLISLNKFTHC